MGSMVNKKQLVGQARAPHGTQKGNCDPRITAGPPWVPWTGTDLQSCSPCPSGIPVKPVPVVPYDGMGSMAMDVSMVRVIRAVSAQCSECVAASP